MITYHVYLNGMTLCELSDKHLRYKGEASDMVRDLMRAYKLDGINRPWRDRYKVAVHLFSIKFNTSHRRKRWIRSMKSTKRISINRLGYRMFVPDRGFLREVG